MSERKSVLRWLGWPAVAVLAYGLVMAAVMAWEGGGSGQASAAVLRVETRYVCMVNNRVYDREQIPVPVGEHVYYGCCEGCKARLAADAAMRRAVDPVSGRVVDKATAIVGALPDGRVYYFESEETLRAFRPPAG